MYDLHSIGKLIVEADKLTITLNKEYVKALKHLDEFSHIHIFYIQDRKEDKKCSLQSCIGEIIRVNDKKGVIEVNTHTNMKSVVKAKSFDSIDSDIIEVIDIKPYFPSDDAIKEEHIKQDGIDKSKVTIDDYQIDYPNTIMVSKNSEENNYSIYPIGLIRNTHGQIFIQLENNNIVDYANISDYIKVFWWFDKFDSSQYRRITQCKPPYENSPTMGVFATRSPVRPNPVAVTVVKVIKVDKELQRIYLNSIESFDKTPCIGIMNYISSKDCIVDSRVPNWLSHWNRWYDDNETKETSVTEYKKSRLEELMETNQDCEINFGEGVARNLEIESLGTELSNNRLFDMDKIKNDQAIWVLGARENNLKGINVRIPYGKITAVVGVSGSGKSSLVNDTIYAESQRRIEYLSSNHNLLSKPKVDSITGCIPTVIISQSPIRGNSQSTVGTFTNAYDYLRIIYANIGIRHCPRCGNVIIPLTIERITNLLYSQNSVRICDLEKQEIKHMVKETNINFESQQVYLSRLRETITDALNQGNGAFYAKFADGEYVLLQTRQSCYHCNKTLFELTPQTFSFIDSESRCQNCNGSGSVVEVDEETLIERPDLSLLDGASSFYKKLRTFKENPNANWMKGQVFGLAEYLNEDLEKPWNDLSEEFRSKLLHGCQEQVRFEYDNKKIGRKGEIVRPVEGLCKIIKRIHDEDGATSATDKYLKSVCCPVCNGERLDTIGRTVTIRQIRYPKAAAMSFQEIVGFCDTLLRSLEQEQLDKVKSTIQSLKEISEAACRLGIGYLRLNQGTTMISGGEGQRLKLLAALLNQMKGICYIFDEPSKGLNPKDYEKVINLLRYLRDNGNTIIMVEHNEDMIKIADNIIEIGPRAGINGGLLVGEGSLKAMLNHKGTQISQYMNGNNRELPYKKREKKLLRYIKMEHLTYRNLKDIMIEFPKQALTCICGVSGSGKSSLMKGEIYNRTMKNKKDFSDVVLVDQLPIGKTSKSIIATYITIMDTIRQIMASTNEAKEREFNEAYFSFNSELGQCPNCKGDGKIKIKYLADSYVRCPDCQGRRYKKDILLINYQNKNINDILNLSVDEAIQYFHNYDEIVKKLRLLHDVGLGYVKIGQGTQILSGGEASRLKLARKLFSSKKKNVLYLLDEPTTGLHFSDIEQLLTLFNHLVEEGNTVVVIEHNKQVMKVCDYIIELGPGAGSEGGQILYQGESQK